MSRLYGSIVVFVFVASMVITDFIYNTTVTNRIQEELDMAVRSAQQQNTDEAKTHIKNCLDTLEKDRSILYLFSSHCQSEEIIQQVERSYEYLDNGDVASFYVYCRVAERLTKDMKELEYPTLQNIL